MIKTIIEHGNRRFVLNKYLDFGDGGWYYDYQNNDKLIHTMMDDKIGVLVRSEDKKELEEKFCASFAETYDGLVNEPDENLTQDARKLKQKYLSIVEKVEQIEEIKFSEIKIEETEEYLRNRIKEFEDFYGISSGEFLFRSETDQGVLIPENINFCFEEWLHHLEFLKENEEKNNVNQ